MPTLELPAEVYSRPPVQSELESNPKVLRFVFDRLGKDSERGGLYAFYKGVPEWAPEKFAVEARSMVALNKVKALTMTIFPSIPLRRPSEFLWNYLRMADKDIGWWYLRSDLNCFACRELKLFFCLLFRYLGLSFDLSWRLARLIITFFEFDIVYRYRLQDLATETYQGELASKPIRTIWKLWKIYKSREQTVDHHSAPLHKIRRVFVAVCLALLLPKVRRAFHKALAEIEFHKLQFDMADRYHCMLYGDYSYFGMTFDQRWDNFVKLHNGSIPERVYV